MVPPQRQASEKYRGVVLPKGMTPQCLDELEKFLAQFESGTFEGFAKDAAIRAFQVVQSHLGKKDHEISS